MSLWIYLGAILFVVVLALLWPLLRKRLRDTTAAEQDMAVYKDQLGQIDADLSAGLIAEADAADARAEVSRRLLAAADRQDEPAAAPGGRATALSLALAVVLVVPLVSVILYSQLGAPGLPDFPFSERQAANPDDAEHVAGLEESIQRLESRLIREPENLEGRILLARSYMAVRRFEEAAQAYEKALDLSPDNPELLSAYGEALTYAGNSVVTPAARAAFESALAKAPGDDRARLYLAVAEEQAGNRQGALDRWVALLKDASPDEPWVETARARVVALAKALGQDPDAVLPEPKQAARSGPDAADMEAAAKMSPEERRTMIEGMVARLAERLATDKDDLDGWLRLGRSYTMLGKPTEARDALANAARLAPKKAEILLLYARAMRAAAGNKQTAESVAVMRQVLALDAENVEALWLVGRAEALAGDKGGLTKMQKALDRMPPDMPRRKELEDYLDEMRSKKS